MCKIKEENMDHFMTCDSYGRTNISWEEIYENVTEKQIEIGSEAKIRLTIREKRKEEDGHASSLAPTAPDRLDLFC
jgi:hypothetical protein